MFRIALLPSPLRSSLLLLLLIASSLLAEPTKDLLTRLYQQQDRVRTISQTAISPDSTKIAWSVPRPGGAGEELFFAPTARPDEIHRVTAQANAFACWEYAPVWSPDSRRLAFLSDCASPGHTQLFVQDVQAAAPTQATHVNGFLSHAKWSSDGRRLAFLFVDRATRRPSPMAAENRAVGVIDEQQTRDVQRLCILDWQSASMTPVSPANLYVFEFDWSRDMRSFVYTAAPPPGDDNWYIARLYTQLQTGASPTLLYRPHWQIALPRWSPDGRSIAYIEGLMSDEGGTGGDIFTISADGGAPRDLTPGRPSSPAWLTWLSDSELLFSEYIAGSTGISTLHLPDGRTQSLWHGEEMIHAGVEPASLSIAAASNGLHCAVVRASWNQLPEVWTGAPGRWQPFTNLNTAVNLPLPRFENVKWSNDNLSVQGWLLFPAGYQPSQRYPLLVAVHGGPAWIATPEWRASDFNTTLFTQLGYFVFFPNPRGSYGEGERFTQANRRDWGFGDLSDILTGVDAVAQHFPIDAQRVGILGWSYGGSTAMMAVTQTHRFRAAVAGAGAANWQSYYGQNAIDQWMLPYFGASVYDDPKAYTRCSAITYIKQAKTPTLVLVGERDGEAPPAQSIEFWHALKELGVPTRLIIYPDEGHSFSRQADRIDVTEQTLRWFQTEMP